LIVALETLAAYAAAILALGVLIMLHEAGHFIVARWSGMGVSRFSIGFGPALAKIESKGTIYQIGAIPLGGFVQIDGLSPQDGTDTTLPTSYRNKPFHLRFATILAGAFVNYLIGFLLLFVFFAIFNYEPLPPVRVSKVSKGTAAAQAGLQEGDLIVGTSSAAFKEIADLPRVIQQSGGKPIVFSVAHDGEQRLVTVTPKAESGGVYRIGIGFEPGDRVDRPLPIGESAVRAASELWPVSKALLMAFVALIKRDGSVEVSGPPGMVRDLSGRLTRGFGDALAEIARISIMLGFFNLLPIPGLDGSRLLFLLVGMIRRREVNPKVEAVVHAVGILLLLSLMVVVSIGDLFE
jgi:regulator of sigma E protease